MNPENYIEVLIIGENYYFGIDWLYYKEVAPRTPLYYENIDLIENILATDSAIAYRYANEVLKDRFELGEYRINPALIPYYYHYILKSKNSFCYKFI